uniref:Uncharacterized protein n=1 Tax=Rousettus aegyptiacus TaxID=9407 RepID=A0A7J8FIP4_ROUAE|nr:hypothetical protein HJG63_012003 [Rousettus aegyptiacus]
MCKFFALFISGKRWMRLVKPCQSDVCDGIDWHVFVTILYFAQNTIIEALKVFQEFIASQFQHKPVHLHRNLGAEHDRMWDQACVCGCVTCHVCPAGQSHDSMMQRHFSRETAVKEACAASTRVPSSAELVDVTHDMMAA